MNKIPRFLEPQHVDGCIAVAIADERGDWFGNVTAGAGAPARQAAFVRSVAPSAILPSDWPTDVQGPARFMLTSESVRGEA